MFQPPLLSSDLIDSGGKHRSPGTKLKDLERSNLNLKLRLDASHRTTQRVVEDETKRLLQSKVETDGASHVPYSSSYSSAFPPSIPRLFGSSSSASIRTPFARNTENDVQLESNLRSERQAALALAQHDSKVIKDLEIEITHLKSKRESEQSLNAELVIMRRAITRRVERFA